MIAKGVPATALLDLEHRAAEVHSLVDALERHRAPDHTALWAMVETPSAILDVREIAAHWRVAVLVMGTNDLARETGASPGSVKSWLSRGRAALAEVLAGDDFTVEQVWEVLSDGWLYALWVVGASRMREVDHGWPQPGARLHHSVGSWPLLLDDVTESLQCVPGSRLVLDALTMAL